MRKFLLTAGALLMLAGAAQAQGYGPPPGGDRYERGYGQPRDRDEDVRADRFRNRDDGSRGDRFRDQDTYRESRYRRPSPDDDFMPRPHHRRGFWVEGDFGPRRICRGWRDERY